MRTSIVPMLFAALVASGPALAGSCGEGVLKGLEDQRWAISIDLKSGDYAMALKTGANQQYARKTGTLKLACFDNTIIMQTVKASDANLCTYWLTRENQQVSGTFHCSRIGGDHSFAGMIESKGASQAPK